MKKRNNSWVLLNEVGLGGFLSPIKPYKTMKVKRRCQPLLTFNPTLYFRLIINSFATVVISPAIAFITSLATTSIL